MREREINRSTWPAGPWDSEPNREEWRDEATGIPCLIVRNGIGALCGYAAVPPGHPWYKVDYNDLDDKVDVHGGLTFSDLCDEGGAICHVPREGEPADVWWLGFDSGHGYDAPPGMLAIEKRLGGLCTWGTYKDMAYMRAEVAKLAAQIAGAA